MLTCVVIGVLSAIEVYVAQLVWPASRSFPDVDTAFVHVAGRVAGPWFFLIMNVTLLVASIGSGMGAQLGATRLLCGMGRSNALPRSFFGAVSSKRHIPRNNVVFVGLVAVLGAFLVSYSLGAEMLNFGALLAFMGVNAAAFVRYYGEETYQFCTATLRFRHLPLALGEPKPPGHSCRCDLDDCRYPLRCLEDPWLSRGSG